MNSKATTLFLASSLIVGASAQFEFGDTFDVGPRYDYSVAPSGNARCALVSIAMDESGSMQTEQEFMKQYAIPRMANKLYGAAYQYDHVFFCGFGFGWLNAPATAPNPDGTEYTTYGFRELGCTEGIRTAAGADYSTALADPSVAAWENDSGGNGEDGYNAIIKGVEKLPESIVGASGNPINLNSACGVFNKNFILVTDEDRDVINEAADIPAVRAAMADNGYILNEVVNLNINNPEASNEETVVGLRMNYPVENLESSNTYECEHCMTANGRTRCVTGQCYNIENEFFTTNIHGTEEGAWTSIHNEIPPAAYYTDGYGGDTIDDYIPLIQNTRGAVWSIRPLRAAIEVGETGYVRELDADKIHAYSEAFIDIKVEEIDCVGSNCGVCTHPPCRTTELVADPHVTTWRNEHFEYHGQCDLVMVKNPEFADGLGIDVHVRTKIVRFWSYIKNVAIRIGNDILEIEGTADETDVTPHFWFNYEPNGELEQISGFPITLQSQSNYKRIYKIDLDSKYKNEYITVQIYKEFVGVRFFGSSASFGTSVGLMGDYYSGKTLGRDGETVLDDFTELGHEWQVLPSEPKLFHELEHPQFPEKCMDPEDPRGERRRRLEESNISVEQAEEACKSLKDPLTIKDCVYDILATQDLDMVGAF